MSLLLLIPPMLVVFMNSFYFYRNHITHTVLHVIFFYLEIYFEGCSILVYINAIVKLFSSYLEFHYMYILNFVLPLFPLKTKLQWISFVCVCV